MASLQQLSATLPTSTTVWRRSKPARHARILFLLAVLLGAWALSLFVAWEHATAALFALFAVGALALAYLRSLAAKREVRRATGLMLRGGVAQAEVTSRRFRFLGWVVRYAYRDAAGNLHQGDSGFLPRREAKRWHRGDSTRVLYDPARPQRSLWAEAGTSTDRPRARIPAWAVGVLGILAIIALVAVVALRPLMADMAAVRDDEVRGLSWRDESVTLVGVTALRKVALGEDSREVESRIGSRAGAPQVLSVDGKVRAITRQCGPADATRVNRVSCSAPEARIREIFGKRVRVLCTGSVADKAGVEASRSARAYDVVETGTRYLLRNGSVTGIVIMTPDDLESNVGAALQPCPAR